jgi:hypothetical protein
LITRRTQLAKGRDAEPGAQVGVGRPGGGHADGVPGFLARSPRSDHGGRIRRHTDADVSRRTRWSIPRATCCDTVCPPCSTQRPTPYPAVPHYARAADFFMAVQHASSRPTEERLTRPRARSASKDVVALLVLRARGEVHRRPASSVFVAEPHPSVLRVVGVSRRYSAASTAGPP